MCFWTHCNSSSPIAIISIAQMDLSILSLRCEIILSQNLHFTFLNLSFGIKYHGFRTFHFASINKTLYIRTICLINIIKVFNNKIKLHLYGYNWNLAPITNAIWWFEMQTPIKVSPFPPKVYGNGWCQTTQGPHTSKEKVNIDM
jgi:hypothetical protein